MVRKNNRLGEVNFGMQNRTLDSLKESFEKYRRVNSMPFDPKDIIELLELVEDLFGIIKDQSSEINNIYQILDRHESGLG